jgi:hypothetical protein
VSPDDKNSSLFDAILRRALGPAPTEVSPECPDAALLAAYCDRSVTAAERMRLENHFSVCPRCQTQLAAIARSNKAVRDYLRTVRFYTIRGWRMVLPIVAAAAALLVTIRIVRPTTNAARNVEMAAVAKPPAPLADFSQSSTKHEAVGAASESQAAAPAAPVPASSIGALAMNESRRAQRPETDQLSESSEPAGRAKTLAKEKRLQAKADLSAATGSSEVAPSNEVRTPPAAGAVASAPTIGGAETSTGATTGALAPKRADSAGSALQNYRAPASALAMASAPLGAQAAPSAAGAGGAPGASTGPTAMNRLDTASEARGSLGTFSPRMLGKASNANSGSVGAQVGLASISSPDQSSTWLVGRNGTIVLRDAAGNSRAQRSGVTTDLNAGAAVSAQVCWVVGRSGTIVRTVDGEHWELVPAPTRDNLVSVVAQSADDAIVRASGGQNFATSDGGASWHPQ